MLIRVTGGESAGDDILPEANCARQDLRAAANRVRWVESKQPKVYKRRSRALCCDLVHYLAVWYIYRAVMIHTNYYQQRFPPYCGNVRPAVAGVPETALARKCSGKLLSGTYKPQPVKPVEIPKPDGNAKAGTPTVLDQRALMQVL